jgi:hypothetical protein
LIGKHAIRREQNVRIIESESDWKMENDGTETPNAIMREWNTTSKEARRKKEGRRGGTCELEVQERGS